MTQRNIEIVELVRKYHPVVASLFEDITEDNCHVTHNHTNECVQINIYNDKIEIIDPIESYMFSWDMTEEDKLYRSFFFENKWINNGYPHLSCLIKTLTNYVGE